MELSPRTSGAAVPQAGPGRRRSRWAYAVLVVVALALGVVAWQGLTNASLYFYNADEAVAQRASLGERRFRLQGTVEEGSIEESAGGVGFTVAFNGVDVAVRHQGDPPQVFQPGIPVVLEGRWDDQRDVFLSDTILVKHSASYEADNGERLRDAAKGGAAGSGEPAAK